MPDVAATEADSKDGREQEQLCPARQHPDDLVRPDVHPTRFPGTWVAIFERSLPIDQVVALRVEGYGLYRHVVVCGNGNLQVIIREDPRPDRDGELSHAPTDMRYKQYEHPYKSKRSSGRPVSDGGDESDG